MVRTVRLSKPLTSKYLYPNQCQATKRLKSSLRGNVRFSWSGSMTLNKKMFSVCVLISLSLHNYKFLIIAFRICSTFGSDIVQWSACVYCRLAWLCPPQNCIHYNKGYSFQSVATQHALQYFSIRILVGGHFRQENMTSSFSFVPASLCTLLLFVMLFEESF